MASETMANCTMPVNSTLISSFPSTGDRPTAITVWATATLFVTIISACSLIGVSIMPLIAGKSYKMFITLFTGLAVGSLVGSAIFSLIPQAFNLKIAGDPNLYKALVIFVGIYLFYCSERIMRLYFESRTRRRNKRRQLALAPNQSTQGPNQMLELADNSIETNKRVQNQIDSKDKDITGGDQSLMATKVTTDEAQLEDGNNQDVILHHHHNHHHNSHHHTGNIGGLVQDGVVGGILNKPGKDGTTSGQQIAPVAWMIIIGDGLHNFIDGLSIGAAFAERTMLGITTSVAVICEEFPHELGDFAVLISSGMTVRQALGYNFLSACTCYLGMIVGIIVGNESTKYASYIFALAGGMFLYISLVDMMGELSAALDVPNQSARETIKLLVTQNIGILTGITIIFILSSFDLSTLAFA